MTQIRKQRLLRRGITALVLALIAVFIVMTAAMYLWPGWYTMPLDKLPALFWIMYIIVTASWFILNVADILRPTGAPKYGRTLVLAILLLVTGVIQVGGSLFGSTWTGGRLLQLTIGGLLLIQSANSLIQAHIAKRRQTT